MSCPGGSGFGVRAYFDPNDVNNKSRKCRKYSELSNKYPSFTPTIYYLSQNEGISGTYQEVFISGANFLPFGVSYVKFGNFSPIIATYYGSFQLSFLVPLNALPGVYDVQVVNLYNSQFSKPVKQSYSGNPNYSNSIVYNLM